MLLLSQLRYRYVLVPTYSGVLSGDAVLLIFWRRFVFEVVFFPMEIGMAASSIRYGKLARTFSIV